MCKTNGLNVKYWGILNEPQWWAFKKWNPDPTKISCCISLFSIGFPMIYGMNI